MTILWFVVWFVCNQIGASEGLELSPVNFWTGSLILAIAIDINRPQPQWGGK